jgi:hypothetical protein
MVLSRIVVSIYFNTSLSVDFINLHFSKNHANFFVLDSFSGK